MRNWLLLAVMAIFTLSVVGIDDADARRFGGGHSFGKQRMHSPAQNHFSQKSAMSNKSAANQRGTARPGMMGMLGGLALGGLLGAMFFGGAFEGINFFDIIVIGTLIALLIWFLRRKAESGSIAFAGGQHGARGFGHDMQQPAGKMLRPNINEKHFLKAARDIFLRMQTAWDAQDMDDIRQFCTPEVAEKIERDMTDSGRNHTEVATLDAQLSDSWIESDLEWAAVDFTAMLREQTLDNGDKPSSAQSGEIHETWIFQHDPNAEDPTWFLAGIQQS